ncbi:MAG: hypothetical protein HLUCCA08_13905 [Rhodobacteraceae bacterium HLUCCA08]|nr:MAG: hypothetical protein HLUCCA08_13905 [Rhodobacteraceae bacterium HLUCCA08]
MAKDISRILSESRTTLLKDALGAVAVFVTLFAGLSLPGTF